MSFIQSDEENENYSLSQSQDNSNNNINGIPFLNKEQILVNWLNTIKQPHCLLINKLTDNDIINNGIVFIEILSNFLNFFGMGDFNPDKRLTKYEKVNLVISSLIELNKGDYYDYNLKQKILFFYNRISDIFTNKKFLISFLELLKEIYDKFGVNLTEGNIENNNIVVNNNYLNDIEEIKESSENEIHQIPQINENLSKSSNSNSITTNPNNVHQNISNLNINLISEGVVSNENQNHIQTPKYNNINDKNEEEMIEYKLKQDKNNSYQKLMTLIKDSYEKKNINQNSYGSNEHFLYKNIINNLRTQQNSKQSKINFSSLSPSHSITLSISPLNYISKNITMDEISNKNNTKNFNFNKKKENNYITNTEKLLKNEVLLTIGLIKKGLNNILQNKIPIYSFKKPTNPIIQISLSKENFIKYIPKINKNIKLKNENIFQPQPIKSQSSEKKQKNKLSESAKNSIKLWLTSLKIINNLNSSDLAILYLCHNGILFNDIINRCGSTNSNIVIKGIIREPYTVGQCKINLKKFFDYVLTNYKLYEYLKNYSDCIDDIINKDEDICFGILFGLFRYFNKDYKNMQNIQINIPSLNLNKDEKNNIFFINQPISTKNLMGKSTPITPKKYTISKIKSMNNINLTKKLLSSRNNSNENTQKLVKSKNISYIINKKKEKENEDFSNFLNALSMNSEYNNINLNAKSSNNLLITKSKKPSNLNSPTVSRCSSIIHSPSNNSSFFNFDVFNNKFHTGINYGNYSYKNNALKINNYLNHNHRNHCIHNLKLVKKKNNSQREFLNSSNNQKCFLLFRSSNISKMKNETKKFLNIN